MLTLYIFITLYFRFPRKRNYEREFESERLPTTDASSHPLKAITVCIKVLQDYIAFIFQVSNDFCPKVWVWIRKRLIWRSKVIVIVFIWIVFFFVLSFSFAFFVVFLLYFKLCIFYWGVRGKKCFFTYIHLHLFHSQLSI